MPPDERSCRPPQPAARRTPDDDIAKGTISLADPRDVDEAPELRARLDPCPDPPDAARHAGELLHAWIDVRMSEVDELVDEARHKVANIPTWRVLVDLVGELVIRQAALEREVAELKKAQR
jgi:hypothetical protein